MIYITQPTYLPWIGYFSFLDKAEEIIFLDDVQFSKRSWQQRNKIIFKENFLYLTVPVKSKGKRNQLIKDVEIYDNLFFSDHLKKIKHCYNNSQYFSEVFNLLENLRPEISNKTSLSNMNILLIKKICEYLKINIKYSNSSKLNINKKRSEKLAEICKARIKFNLMSNEGTIDYMENDMEIFKRNNIKIKFYKYETVNYRQLSKKFEEKLSILDLMFNEGPNSLKIIRKGLQEINPLR